MKKSFIICVLLFTLVFSSPAAAEPIGFISVPGIKITMPLYTAGDKKPQEIIDDENSALFNRWGRAYQIEDHAFSEDINGNQWNIQKIFPGAYAWIYTEDKTFFLECYFTGKTNYIEGNEYLNNTLITPNSSTDIMLVCCAENSKHHFVAVFRRLQTY